MLPQTHWRHTLARVKGWPPLHIPIVVGVAGVGLLDFGDGNLAILRLPALGGLFDLPGLALGGGVLDLNVDVGHCEIRDYSGKRYHRTRPRPDFEWRATVAESQELFQNA